MYDARREYKGRRGRARAGQEYRVRREYSAMRRMKAIKWHGRGDDDLSNCGGSSCASPSASLNCHLPQVKSSMPFVASRPVGLAAIDAELALLGAVKSCCSGSDSVRSSVDVKLRRFDREKAIGQVWRGNWLSSAVTAVPWSPALCLLLFYPSIAVHQSYPKQSCTGCCSAIHYLLYAQGCSPIAWRWLVARHAGGFVMMEGHGTHRITHHRRHYIHNSAR